MKKHSIFRNISSLTLSFIINRIIMFIFVLFIARTLGSANFGKFAFAFAFTQLFFQISDFGLNSLMVRQIVAKKEMLGGIFYNMTLLRIAVSVLSLAAAFSAAVIMQKSQDVVNAVVIFSAANIVNVIILSVYAVYRGFERMIYESVSNILQVVVYAFFGILFAANKFSIEYIALSYLAGLILVFFISAVILNKKFQMPKFSFDKKVMAGYIKTAWPFGISLLFTLGIARISVVLVSVILGNSSAGLFQSVYTLVVSINMVAGMAITGIYPRIVDNHIKGGGRLASGNLLITKVLFFLIIPVVCFVSLFSGELVNLAFGPEYAESGTLLKIMIWSVIPFTISNICGNVLMAVNKEKMFAFLSSIVFAAACVIFSLNLILMNLKGGAVSVVLVDLFMASVFYAAARRSINIKFAFILKTLILISAVYFSALMLNTNMFLESFLAIAIYLFLSYILRYFDKNDILRIKNIMPANSITLERQQS